MNTAGFVTQSSLNTQLSNYAAAMENATGVGFSSGNPPSPDGTAYPYIYHNSGLYVALATQSYAQSNFVNTPNGTSVVISGSNLNSSLKTGFYRGSGLINAPLNNTGWWYVTVETHDPTWVKQTATSFGSGNNPNITYQRTMAGGSWSNWAQVWNAQDFTSGNIQQWNYMAQNGLQLNSEFTIHTGAGLLISDNKIGSESGIIDAKLKRFLATKRKDYYFYGSDFDSSDGLNFNCNTALFGMGRMANKTDKLTVAGSVKASKNFKSEKEDPDTIFIPNGREASLRNEIINDQSDPDNYAIRLDPKEYEFTSSYLNIIDNNRLIHVIGELADMVVVIKEVYPKQQFVIYNFDYKGNSMKIEIAGKGYEVSSHCFLRLYVTTSGKIILEREQPCKII